MHSVPPTLIPNAATRRTGGGHGDRAPGQGQRDDAGPVPAYVEGEFRRYLDCGVLAHGFARARCGQCGHDFLIAFSCKGRAVCPSCNSRRMVATAAHLTDHVLPDLPVRQWVLAVPQRLRYFLERDAALQVAGLRLFLRAVESCLRTCSPDAGAVGFRLRSLPWCAGEPRVVSVALKSAK